MRERAQQSWPALPNTRHGAAAAAASRSASAKTTFADLPPSSSVTRLIVAAAPAAIERPTSVEPVNAILRDVGVLDQALPARAPGPDDDVDDALGQARLERELGEAQRGQRRQLGRLEHDRVAGRERRRRASRTAIVSGKFHGVISPTTPSGSRTVNAWPPATGIVSPSSRSGAPA